MHKTFNINFNLSRDISRSENPEEETFYDPEHIHSEIVNWLEDLDFTVKDMKVEEIQQGTVYTGDAPSTEASFYKKTFVGISETEYKKSEVEDLDNQSYSEGEEYDNDK